MERPCPDGETKRTCLMSNEAAKVVHRKQLTLNFKPQTLNALA